MALDRKIATVNLSTRKVETTHVPRALREAYLGGRGLNTVLLHSRMQTIPDPFAVESVVVIGTGLLTGTPTVGASRTLIAYRSPLSGYLGTANLSGHFGAELRFAGFDHLVVTGKAPALSVLAVMDEEIRILDAPHLAGRRTQETVALCREMVADGEAQVLCIGPAGERKVFLADVRPGFGEGWGGAGLGAILGEKNLKAVVVRGTGSLGLFTPKEALLRHGEDGRRLRASKTGRALSALGPIHLASEPWGGDRLRYRHEDGGPHGSMADVEPRAFARRSPRGSSCFACPLACRRLYPAAMGLRRFEEGPGFESHHAFTYLMGMNDAERALEADQLCRAEGLHPTETGAALAWTAGTLARDVLKPAQVDEPPPAFGDPDLLLPWIRRIALGEGFGQGLGRGIRRAGEQIGVDARRLAVHVKGLAMPPFDVRRSTSTALASATAAAGPDWQTSAPIVGLLGVDKEELGRVLGGPQDFASLPPADPTSPEGKVVLVVRTEAFNMVADCLGLCRFVTAALDPGLLGIEDFSRLLRTTTGI
ncbi:MAG: aldehyde ferredoxin oxidoreductase N-terminal domain-containing protein, partial [Planctomycetota bacterium]